MGERGREEVFPSHGLLPELRHSLMGLFRTWFPPPRGSSRVVANTLVRMSLLWSLDGVVRPQCLMNVSVTSQLYSGLDDSHEGRQRPLARGGQPYPKAGG